MSWLKNQKQNHHCEMLSLILCNDNKPLLNEIMTCKEKQTLYDNTWPTAKWLGWEETWKPLPQQNLHTKKSWSPFGCLLLLWSIRAFWIPEKPLYLRHMLSKSMRCTKNPCNARSQYWSTERSHSSPLHCQITCSTTYTSKVGWIGLKFSLTCHIHLTSYQLTTTSSSFSKAFCREKTSTISKRQKMLSKSSSNSEAWIFIATGISKLFFFGKNLLTVMVLILINKDMFESTYDLKFMAPNCNYICTKLIFFYPS